MVGRAFPRLPVGLWTLELDDVGMAFTADAWKPLGPLLAPMVDIPNRQARMINFAAAVLDLGLVCKRGCDTVVHAFRFSDQQAAVVG